LRRHSSALDAVVIRPAGEDDLAAVEEFVSSVASAVYSHLFPGDPPRPDGNWAESLVADLDGRIIGVVVADDDWIADLWVAEDCRNQGVGSRLLAAGERQIAARGHERGYLRVVAENLGARRFYARHGWSETESYPHERWGFAMVDMVKQMDGVGAGSSP
jgi:GNAT superfamily N-acetyltransferase